MVRTGIMCSGEIWHIYIIVAVDYSSKRKYKTLGELLQDKQENDDVDKVKRNCRNFYWL
jgi:hypothetical protein